jgi:hypothetical protein
VRRRSLTLAVGCGLLLLALPAFAEPAPAPAGSSLEIPDVVVEGSEPPTTSLPSVSPTEPKLETQFNPPAAGPSATERDLTNLHFRTEPNLFTPTPMSYRDGRTVINGSFGRPDWFQFGGWDSRQIGPFHSFLQADYAVGTGIVAPWQKGLARLGLGFEHDGWRFNLAGDGELSGRRGDFGVAGQMWGNGRLSVVQPLGPDSLTYHLGWESGHVQGSVTERITVQQTVTPIGDGPVQSPIALTVGDQAFHGGDAGARWEPVWGDHKPLLDLGGGFHWAGLTAWPVGTVIAADRFQWGPSDWQIGAKYDMVGGDHSVAPMIRAAWRGWPETLFTATIDGGQQAPFAGTILRQRPFAQFNSDLRSEYMLAQAHLHLDRRLTRGLVLGLGADLGAIDRKLFWSRMGETPFWQLRNAPGPMLQWGGDASVRYELGGVVPFVTYRFQQASTPEPLANYPTDGNHELRLGFEMGFERFRLETAARVLMWNLSPVASGREQGAQPNVLLLDGALAYDITDTVHAHLRVSDGLLRSSDMLPGYWEPAFAVMGGVGVQF